MTQGVSKVIDKSTKPIKTVSQLGQLNRYKDTEVGAIPADWDVVSLGNLGKFKNGINKDADSFGYGFPFVNLMDVFGTPSLRDSSGLGLLSSTEIERKEYNLRLGDVLFVRSSVKPSGVGLTSVVDNELINTVYSGFLIRFRSDERLTVGFKKYCFYEEDFRRRLIAASSASANTNINQDNLKNILLVVPPSANEQNAIASALSDIDELIVSLEFLLTKKQAIKAATMQQLLTGRTRLPQFAQREDGKPKGYKASELGEIPEDWNILSFGDVLSIRHGKSQREVESAYGKYPIYATGGQIGSASSFICDKPSVLIGRKGTIDKPRFADTPFWTVDTLFYSEISELAHAKFIFYKFCMVDWMQYNEASGVPSLSSQTVESIRASFPELEEQKAIARVLSDMDLDIQTLEGRLNKTRQIKQGMMQELLTGKTRLI